MIKVRINKSKFILLFSGLVFLVLMNSNNFQHNLLTNDNAYNNNEINVADELDDNFYAISKSNKVTNWTLESYDSYWMPKFVDDMNTHQWDILVSNNWFLRGSEQANNYLLNNYTFGNNYEWLYSGESYNLVGSRTYRMDICWDGSYWYLLCTWPGAALIYKYSEDFTPIYNDPGIDIQPFTLSPNKAGYAVQWNGSHYFVLFPNTQDVGMYASISEDWPSELQSYNLPSPGIDYYDIGFDNNNWWVLGSEGINQYAYKFYLNWTYSGFKVNLNQLLGVPTDGGDFQTLEWDGTYWWYSGLEAYTYKIYSNWTYLGERFNARCNSIILKDTYFYRLSSSSSDLIYKYFSENTLVYNISKFYQGNGFAYIQSGLLETLSLKSSIYDQNTSLTSGEVINVDFITNSASEIMIYLYSGNELTKSFILSPSGNSNFQRHTVTLNIEENVVFDHIIISSTIPDKKYIILYNINCESPNTDHYYEEFYVDPLQSHSLNLTTIGYMGFPLQYNLKIFEDGIKKVDENIYLDFTDPYYYTYYSPSVNINSPHSNELFGNNSPSFNIEIKNNNGIDQMWFSLDNGLTNITFTTNGTINQDLWDSLSNGTVIISFYVKDSIGNIGNNSVIVRVDKEGPLVKINSPLLNELFELTPPSFNIEINDEYIDKMWYTINEGSKKYYFLSNDSIDFTAWSPLLDGRVTFQFYANDSAGNIGFAEVSIRKDVNVPIIAINNPQNSHVIGAISPNFDISIDELNLDKAWYSLNGGNNVTFTGLTGTINQALWDALPEGNVIIRFYANDTLGRIGFQEVIVVKTISQPSPSGIPGYNVFLLLGIVSTIAVIIVKKRLKHLN